MRVAKDEEKGLDAAEKTIIFPPYCTIVHSSCGSWACVFPPLYHTLPAIPAVSPSPFCSFTPSPPLPTTTLQPELQQWSLSAFFFTLFVVPLFSLSYCSFYFFFLKQPKRLVTLQPSLELIYVSLVLAVWGVFSFLLLLLCFFFNNWSLNHNNPKCCLICMIKCISSLTNWESDQFFSTVFSVCYIFCYCPCSLILHWIIPSSSAFNSPACSFASPPTSTTPLPNLSFQHPSPLLPPSLSISWKLCFAIFFSLSLLAFPLYDQVSVSSVSSSSLSPSICAGVYVLARASVDIKL